MSVRIAVVGGGVAGATTALALGSLGLEVTLLERRRGLVEGPPFCHLHAGGNLYREIPLSDCITLLRQSIGFARLFPCAIDARPTLFALPCHDPGTVQSMVEKLEAVRDAYGKLIQTDRANAVLGPSERYFRLFGEEELERIVQEGPRGEEERWLVSVAKHLDRSMVKFPIALVREYGINLFRVSASLTLALKRLPDVQVHTGALVTSLERLEKGWRVHWHEEGKPRSQDVDYLVNAAGFQSGLIDDMAGYRPRRLVEFKAAYVCRWECEGEWPEIVFHGERNTPRGMAQFTPYAGGHFQVHGMTPQITLFQEGLAHSSDESAQPQLPVPFLEKIEQGWPRERLVERTEAAIRYVAQYLPAFKDAKVASQPLYGAQQVPGEEISLRAADVSFEEHRYARCEIVKVSSVIDAVEEIEKDLVRHGLLERMVPVLQIATPMRDLKEEKIGNLAKKIARRRGYPETMGERIVPCETCLEEAK